MSLYKLKNYKQIVDKYIGNKACICRVGVAGPAVRYDQFIVGVVVNIAYALFTVYLVIRGVQEEDYFWFVAAILVMFFSLLPSVYGYFAYRKNGHNHACSKHIAIVRFVAIGSML
jgi:hypothetical protein